MFKFKVETIQPVQVDIKDNRTTPSFQQSLLLQQKSQALAMLNQANDNLDNKAANLLQSAALIIALSGVISIPGFIRSDDPTFWIKVGLAIAFLLFTGMIVLSVIAWSPEVNYIPGSLDENWNELYKQYLLVDPEASFNQVLRDYTVTIDRLKTVNMRKGRLVKWSVYLFAGQIAGLMTIPWIPDIISWVQQFTN